MKCRLVILGLMLGLAACMAATATPSPTPANVTGQTARLTSPTKVVVETAPPADRATSPSTVAPLASVSATPTPSAWPTMAPPQQAGLWQSYTTTQGLASSFVSDILIDGRGQIWAAHAIYALSRLEGQSWTAYNVPEISNILPRPIAVDSRGQIWVSTFNKGLYVFNGQAWQTYTAADGLAADEITAVVSDAAGQIWVGTNGGLSVFDGQTWTTYTPANGLAANEVTAIANNPAGGVWVATQGQDAQGIDHAGAISYFDGQTWTTYTTEDGLAEGMITTIFTEQAGQVWVAVNGVGLSHFDGQTWQTYTVADGLAGSFIKAIIQDQIGRIWVNTAGQGLNRFDGQTWTTYTVEDGLASNDISALFADAQGRVWAGTYGFGLSIFDGQDWTILRASSPDAPPGGLVNDIVYAITGDGAGRVWIATEGGVSVFDGGPLPVAPSPEPALPATQPDPTLPLLAELPAEALSVGETDLALLYTRDEILYRFDVNQPAAQPLAHIGWPGLLSQDLRYLAYADEDGLRAQNLASGETFLLRQHTKATGIDPARVEFITPYSWSPKNTLLARIGFFESSTLGGWISMTDRAWRAAPFFIGCPSSVAWSQSGDYLALSSQDWGHPCGSGLGLTIINTQDRTWQRIIERDVRGSPTQDWTVTAAATGIGWAPSDAWLAVALEEDAVADLQFPSRLYRVRPDGSELTPLTTNTEGQAGFPVWQTNGALYYALTGVGPDADGIYGYDPLEGTHTWLIPGSDLQPLNVSPDGGHLLYRQKISETTWSWQIWSAETQQTMSLEPGRFVGWLAGQARQQPWRVETLLVAPGEPGRLYALLAKTATKQLLISDDFGETWTRFAADLPVEPACLTNVNLDYATPDALYASTCQGIYRWSDGVWDQLSAEITDQVTVVYGDSNHLWATASNDVLIRYSDNAGQTWVSAAEGLSDGQGIGSLAIDPRANDMLYAIVRQDNSGGLLQRRRVEAPWSPLPPPTPIGYFEAGMALDGGTGILYVTTTAGIGQLWRSLNPDTPQVEDIAWELVHDFAPGIRVELLASGWGPDGLALYANMTADAGLDQPLLYRSLDGGQTWSRLAVEF